jgi:hypothetical protein
MILLDLVATGCCTPLDDLASILVTAAAEMVCGTFNYRFNHQPPDSVTHRPNSAALSAQRVTRGTMGG